MKQKLDRLFIVAHLLTALYVYLLGWWALAVIPVVLLLFALGQGAFAHRIFTHGSMTVGKRGSFIGHLIFNMCAWGSALTFGAIHRMHHRYSGTEQDPHEPRYIGKWNMLIGNWNLVTDLKWFKRKYKSDPQAAWFHKHYFTIAWIGMPLFAPLTAASFWLRYLLLVVVHDGDDEDTSQDKWWLWPLLLGDEMHNVHHKSATKAKHHNLDMCYWTGRLLQLLR